jgi:hypothetical protein
MNQEPLFVISEEASSKKLIKPQQIESPSSGVRTPESDFPIWQA